MRATRRALCVAALAAAPPRGAVGWGNGVALTPPMGWSSWNAFHRHFNETNFYEAADLMQRNGMQAAGYQYINVDGGWWNSTPRSPGHKPVIYRNVSGFPSWDPAKYPRGLPALIDYIHRKGFKYGHYTDAGTGACDHESGMSEGYERQDAALFAEWGIDMLKVDACGVHESNQTVVARWKKELAAAGRPILFSNCHNGCASDPFMKNEAAVGWAGWCADDAHMWRTSRDIEPSWVHVMYNLHTLVGLGARGGPGRWNDPDFLEMGAMHTLDAKRAHFSMWAVTSSPLIYSSNLARARADDLAVLTNAGAIRINQQYAGDAGDRLNVQGGAVYFCVKAGACLAGGEGEAWYKPLPNRSAAVALLNPQQPNGTSPTLRVRFADLPALGLRGGGAASCVVRDVWEGNTSTAAVEWVAARVAPMSVRLLLISACH